VPVVAVAVGVPAAAASVGSAAELTYSVAPLIDVYAPYGAQSILVSNGSDTDYSGPLTFETSAWTSTAPFVIPDATMTAVGSTNVWTVANASIPANQTVVFPLTWDGPYPAAAEQQTLTVTADPNLATVTPVGEAAVASPYQLLWYAVTPGGEGMPDGTPSFFIGNTTETAFGPTSTVRMQLWGFPLSSFPPIIVDGVPYPGRRIVDGGIIARYDDVLTTVASRGGKLDFDIQWGTALPSVQQARQLNSITPAVGGPLTLLGTGTLYSPYNPPIEP
jgi:hypothetical protein